jgi:hypothetical protein
MKGIIAEGEETMGEDEEAALTDAATACAARRVEHYEMAAYAGAHVADLLQQNLDEEREAGEKLGDIAAEILQMTDDSFAPASSQLYGVAPNDPATMVLATAGIAAVTVLHGYLTALRATCVDPITALRYEGEGRS